MQEKQRGNTLLEVVMAVTITSLLVAVVLSIGSEVMAFTSNTQSDFDAQHEANRAFRRVAEAMRKSGWNVVDETNYPLVNEDENQITFQVLTDMDGNGHAFDETTGELEWDPRLFSIRIDPEDDTMYVFDGETRMWTLGRHIQEVQFETFREDASLHFKEVRVSITAVVTMRDGTEATYTTAGSIHMRN